MKPSLLAICFFILVGCQNESGPQPEGSVDTVLYYPYSPVYTSGYEKGKAVHGQIVLNCWKELETGNIFHAAEYFEDSVRLILPDLFLQGSKDTVLRVLNHQRRIYKDVQFYIDSWMPVKATDTGDELVLLWGRKDGTKPEGNRDYLVLHELWWFSENGKVRQMIQYITHPH